MSSTPPIHFTPRSQSPKRSPKPSPIRRPLHERSPSQSNERLGPTIRIVQDEDAEIYSKNPFPSHPSHILSPHKNGPFVFEDRGLSVSDPPTTSNALSKAEPSENLIPKPLQLRKVNRASTSTTTSDPETLTNYGSPFSPSSSRFSHGTSPPSSPPPLPDDRIGGLGLHDDVYSGKRPTIRAIIPSSSTFGGDTLISSKRSTLDNQPNLIKKISEASLASSASSDTFSLRKHDDRRNSSNISVITSPRNSNRHSTPESRRTSKQASSASRAAPKPVLKKSEESFSTASTTPNWTIDRPRSASSPTTPSHAVQTSVTSGAKIQYPVIRQPSASGSWAETSSTTLKKRSPRMNEPPDRALQRNSKLSTIPSESEPRSSQSIAEPSHSSNNRRRQTIASIASSNEVTLPSSPSETSIPVPQPLFSPRQEYLSEPGRDSDERDDIVSELRSPPPLRQQRSGYLSQYSADSRPSSQNSQRSAYTTFLSQTLPDWARTYYQKGDRNSLGAPDSSTESSDSRVNTAQSGPSISPSEANFPLSIFRPRNRPHAGHALSSNPVGSLRNSMIISEAPLDDESYVIAPPIRHISESFTPRLQRDRRSTAVLSAWRAPSFDESFTSLFFSRGNRQILLFCIGFVFPPAWWIASFMPLPANPGLDLSKEATASQLDIERAMARELGPLDERRYLKALWWRNLNRIMSFVGAALVAAVITLAIIASRM